MILTGLPHNHVSLEPFMANFCDTKPEHSPDAHEVGRTTLIQPNCFWALTTPLPTIIGLATNAPEHGVVKKDQIDWLVGELKAAPKSRALLVALHHPPLSVDGHPGASVSMRNMLDGAFSDAARWPDLVLSGHIHTYQRFSRPLNNGETLAYIVAGAGGYPNLHTLAKVGGAPPPVPWTDPVTGWTLANYSQEHRHGFLRLSVTSTSIDGTYTAVPRPQESWASGPVTQIDTFSIPIRGS
jgi:acid phosphatase type 7